MAKSSSQKRTETTNQVTNQTSRPVVDPTIDAGFRDLFGRIGQFGTVNPQSLVAPASQLQQQAFQGAQGLTNSPGSALLGQAAGIAGQTINPSSFNVKARSLLDGGLDRYLNPYQSKVTDAYTTDFDETAGQTRAMQAAQAAANGAFGGSRYGIQEAQTEGELSRARASGLAGILQGGYDRATSLADADANRAQQAAIQSAANRLAATQAQLSQASLLGNLGTTSDANNRANLGLLGDLGSVQQQIDAQQRTAELSQLQALASLYGSFPSQLYTGQQVNGTSQGTGTTTQTQNPGLLGTIGQGAQVAGSLAALFSDETLKENIVPIGEWRGYPIYGYNYVWSDEPQIGVMAQEIASMNPAAIGSYAGFMTVDYGRL
jgi:hypothetical protein